MPEIAILGAGMAGFGASYKFHKKELKSVLYEKQSYSGGHATSYEHGGFTFDDGPHISFTKDERFKRLLAESVGQEYEKIKVQANNYWKGHWIKHPAQCNLYGLPVDLVVDILTDFIETRDEDPIEILNYEDWLITTFGKRFAEIFPAQYAKKFHTSTADNLSIDWLEPRFYKPNLREMLYGAFSATTKDVHYVSNFRYPLRGGFKSFLRLFEAISDVKLEHEVIKIDLKRHRLFFANGASESYEHLISSLPLPELISVIPVVPGDVAEAAKKLACTTCILVTIGINRSDISNAHWTYFYDHDFIFSRLSFPHMQSQNNAPDGTGMIQAEVYFSEKYRKIDRTPEDYIEIVISDLNRCGLLNRNDRVLFSDARIIKYANIIFDLDRFQALEKVNNYLDEVGIMRCGRYGEWGYHWTDESFKSGENAAENVLKSL